MSDPSTIHGNVNTYTDIFGIGRAVGHISDLAIMLTLTSPLWGIAIALILWAI